MRVFQVMCHLILAQDGDILTPVPQVHHRLMRQGSDEILRRSPDHKVLNVQKGFALSTKFL